jgi:hypothetical protein
MLKSITVLEFEKNGKKVQITLPPEMSLGEFFDVTCEARQFVINKMQEVQDAQTPKQQEEQKAA